MCAVKATSRHQQRGTTAVSCPHVTMQGRAADRQRQPCIPSPEGQEDAHADQGAQHALQRQHQALHPLVRPAGQPHTLGQPRSAVHRLAALAVVAVLGRLQRLSLGCEVLPGEAGPACRTIDDSGGGRQVAAAHQGRIAGCWRAG